MNRISFLRQFIYSVSAACMLGACTLGAGSTSDPSAQSGMNSADESSQMGVDTPATDPAYRLSKGDEIGISVFNEGEFSSSQRIDDRGIVRMPYVGEIMIANRSVRDAEKYLEGLLIEKKLLREPMVTIGVREYAPREVSVLGAMNRPGIYRMPRDSSSVEIVELVTNMGGLKPTAKGDDVQVSRTLESGEEQLLRVDVEAMINPRKGGRNTPRNFLVYPGDRIYVPERLW